MNNLLKTRVVSVISGAVIVVYGMIVPLQAIAEPEPTEQPQEQTTSQSLPVEATGITSPATETAADTTIIPPPTNDEPSNQTSSPEPPENALVNQQEISNESSQTTTTGDINASNNDIIISTNTGNAESNLNLTNVANNVTTTTPGSSSDTVILEPNNTQDDISFGLQAVATNNQQSNSPLVTDTTIINSTSITNTVTVDTASGTTNLEVNDGIGSATTGDALSNIEILNLANTIVTSGDSLIGVLNIHGDYDGDIILGQDIMNKLAGDNSDQDLKYSEYSLLKLDEQMIYNNIEANALSGSIISDNNDEVGILTTGTTQTQVVINNLLGNFVVYDNSLIVVVSALGGWDGDVLGARGSNIFILNGIGNNNTQPSLLPTANSNLSIFNSTFISNQIKASSSSGDINLKDNDYIGSANSGNASVNIKLVNSINHVTSYADWLGILFINIFGSWNGSVVPASTAPEDVANSSSNSTGSAYKPPAATVTNLGYPSFTVNNSHSGFILGSTEPTQDVPTANQEKQTKILGASPITKLPPTSLSGSATNSTTMWLLLTVLIMGLVYSGYKAVQYQQVAKTV